MTVHLLIKNPLYVDYFSYLFPPDLFGIHSITRHSDLGKAIAAMIRYAVVKPKEEVPENAVKIAIPNTSDLSTARNRFLFLDREDQTRLNDLLEIYFNIDFDQYYLKGLKMALQQKEIIESFIVSRRLTNLLSDNETLKKRQYRSELEALKCRVKQLQNRAYHRAQKIEFEPQKYLTN